MDYSQFSKDKIELSNFTWLDFKNVNGALVKDGFDGEIQFYDGNFGTAKTIKLSKEL